MSKIAKIAGIVMAVHVVIFLVVVQPGCQTQPPTGPSADSSRVGEQDWDDSDFEAEAETESVPRERYAPRRPEPEEPRTPADDVADDILQPLPSEPVRRGGTAPEAEATIYTVRSGDSLWVIAQRHGLTVRELIEANNLSESAVIQPGQELRIPGGGRQRESSGSRASRSAPPPEGTTTYTVARGDSLSVIAQRHGTSVSRLRELNDLSGDTIRAGQTLIVPEGGQRSSSSGSGSRDRERAAPSNGKRHVVASGETPGGIASQYGVSVDELMHANNISDPRRMRIGQELIIPGQEEDEPAETASRERSRDDRDRDREPSREERDRDSDSRAVPVEPAQPSDDDDEADDIPVIPVVPRSN